MQERIKKRFSQIVLFKIFKQAKLWLFMLQVLSHDFDTYDLFYGRQAVSLYIFSEGESPRNGWNCIV